MPSRIDASPRRIVVQAFFAIGLVLAAIPAYLGLPPSWRPAAVRVACALIVVIGCIRVLRGVRRSIASGGLSASVLDASPSAPPAPELDERFLRLRDDLVFSSRSRRYFDVILWPRLSELSGPKLPPPATRRWIRRRGPSLRTLERLIADVERRA
ncbi:MAG: hypothetical protein C5B48_16435 [Candidatus Rokuibacteriota bacterium]|nr:MAG: hypothetical protein C5B48_16435 [Candidatus Rokubacteria bacterium]